MFLRTSPNGVSQMLLVGSSFILLRSLLNIAACLTYSSMSCICLSESAYMVCVCIITICFSALCLSLSLTSPSARSPSTRQSALPATAKEEDPPRRMCATANVESAGFRVQI